MRIRRQRDMDDRFKWDIATTGTATVTPDNRWPVYFHRFDDEARKAYWMQHRTEILKSWISEHPGTRPHAWWMFDAPGFRKKISGSGPDDEALQESGCGSENGLPDLYDDPYEIRQDAPIFESQATFLLRHKLMTLAEKNRLKKADYDPEPLKIR